MADGPPCTGEHQADRPYDAIRTATSADVNAISAIEIETFRQPLPTEWFARAVEDAVVGVAEADGAVIGYISAHLIPTGSGVGAHLTDLAVSAAARGRGVGRELLRWVLAQVEECTHVELEVRRSNSAARGLYRSEGFTARGYRPRYYADGEDAVVMTQTI